MSASFGSTYRNDLAFADRPHEAPIVHLTGPLTLQLVEPPRQWAPGENVELAVLFGTPGLGKETFAYMIHSFKSRPTAEVRFPAKNPGDPPVVVKVALAGGSQAGFTGSATKITATTPAGTIGPAERA